MSARRPLPALPAVVAVLALALGLALGPAAADPLEDCLAAGRVEALAPCEAAARVAPDDPEIRRRLAWALLANHAETRAVETFAALAAARPDDPQAHYDLASVLLGLRMYEQALAPTRRALVLAPDRVAVLRLGATLYALTERYEDAFDLNMKMALRGVPTGLFAVAQDFTFGRGVPPDQRRARDWYERAAERGHVGAMRELAERLRYGAFGTPPEPDLADLWEDRAQAAIAGLPTGRSGEAPQ